MNVSIEKESAIERGQFVQVVDDLGIDGAFTALIAIPDNLFPGVAVLNSSHNLSVFPRSKQLLSLCVAEFNNRVQ